MSNTYLHDSDDDASGPDRLLEAFPHDPELALRPTDTSNRNTKSTDTYKNYAFTWNNPAVTASLDLASFFRNYCDYMYFAWEQGKKEGTPHYQGVLRFRNNTRWSQKLRRTFPWVITPVYSTLEKAKVYCMKEEGTKFEYGVSAPWMFDAFDGQVMYDHAVYMPAATFAAFIDGMAKLSFD